MIVQRIDRKKPKMSSVEDISHMSRRYAIKEFHEHGLTVKSEEENE